MNDTVYTKSKQLKGTVRFKGDIKGIDGCVIGIEMSNSSKICFKQSFKEGDSDGSYQGQSFFTCKANHGTFLPLAEIELVISD